MGEEIVSEKALTLIGKIKTKQWKEMSTTVKELKDFVDLGGVTAISSFIDEIKETFRLQIEDMLSPLKNELDTLINTLILPLVPIIQDLSNWLLPFMTDLRKGMQGFLENDWPKFMDDTGKNFKVWWDKVTNDIKIFMENWEAFWKDPLGGLRQLNTDYNEWAAGVGQDIAAGWSGFWRDLGWV